MSARRNGAHLDVRHVWEGRQAVVRVVLVRVVLAGAHQAHALVTRPRQALCCASRSMV